MPAAIIRPVTCPVLIGRGTYLDAVTAALDRVQDRAGGVLLISGEAGIGKSRLLHEAIRQATHRLFTCLTGNAFDAESKIPFAPLADVLRSIVSGWDEAELERRLSTPPEQYVVDLLPEMAARGRRESSSAETLEPAQQKRRLYAALDTVLLEPAATQPALFAIEDVHWADETSLDYLLHLARRIARLPALLIVTYRSDEIGSPLRHFLASLDRERLATEAALVPLSRGEVGEMLGAIFDLPQPPSADLLQALYDLTEGNPFFIEEVLHILVARGDIFRAQGKWDRKPIEDFHIPRTVHDTVRRRSQELSADATRVVNIAAVLGRRFDFAVLHAVSGHDEVRLLELLKELIGAQLLVEESDERYRFRHALTHQAVYSELLGGERRLLHRMVAETLERLSAGAPDAMLGELATHYFAAHVWEKAASYSTRLGERALALFSPGAAVEHFSRALEANRRLGLTPSADLLRSRGAAHETLGNFERALADYARALELVRGTDDWRAEWELLRDLGDLWTGRDYARAEEYYRLAYARARASGDATVIARSLNSLGNWMLNVDRPIEARQHHEEALAVFESLGDRHGMAETLDFLGMTLYLSGDPIGGTQVYERGVALMRELDERKLLASALASMPMRGMTWHSDAMVPAAPNLAAALVEGYAALQIAREIGWQAGEAYTHLVLAYGESSLGHYEAALEHVRQGLDIATEIEHQQWLCGLSSAHGQILLDLFALDDARVALEESLRLARAIGSRHWINCASSLLARCHLQRGAVDTADALLRDALPPDSLPRTLGQRHIWCARVEAALARNEPERALALTAEVTAVTPHANGPEDTPRVAWLCGRALAALGRSDEAERLLVAAESLARTHGARPLLWRIQAELCRLADAQNRPCDAERENEMRETVTFLAEHISDAALRERFLAGASTLMPATVSASRPNGRASRRKATEAPGGLTAREREVAVLVAEGLPNRTIAERLVIGERTVETHVTNILIKVGCTNRAQLAAWVVASDIARLATDGPARN